MSGEIKGYQGLSKPSSIPQELWELCISAEPAAISDALNARGLSHRVLQPGVTGVVPGTQVCGLARTLVSRHREGQLQPGHEYAMLIESIDDLKTGEVIVTDSMNCCVWGELCSERAMERGSNGVVVDGFHRDTKRILESGFPVFSYGAHMSDLLYHREIIGRDQPVACAGVQVESGDLVCAGMDGVVVVPSALIREIIEEAAAKSSTEDEVRSALRSGRSAKQVWDEYQIL